MSYHLQWCWKPLQKTAWETEWGGLETWLLINLVTIVYAHPHDKLQETRVMYGIVVLLFSNALKLKIKQTGVCESDIFRSEPLAIFLILSLSIAPHYIPSDSLVKFNKCVCQLSPAWRHI